LAGGCASIESIDKLIEEELGIPAFVANPFINMALSNKIKPRHYTNNKFFLPLLA
jgi:type IV pilus assembly protein PilM